jgi:flagellar basal-body rod modification protein FlgD
MSLVSPIQNDATNVAGTSDRSLSLGKDEFLQLLITKLQNQDPLKPMDDEDFIAQLAQFSSLEQMNNISEGIAEANQWDYLQMQSLNNAMAAGFVGKDIQASYDGIYMDSGNSTGISFSLPSYADEVEFTIRDSAGSIVATLTEKGVTPGSHSVQWDGRDSSGNQVPDGYYSVEAVATTTSGSTFTPDLSLVGTVEAVLYREGTAYLRVNGVEIPLGNVTAIGEKGAFSDEE